MLHVIRLLKCLLYVSHFTLNFFFLLYSIQTAAYAKMSRKQSVSSDLNEVSEIQSPGGHPVESEDDDDFQTYVVKKSKDDFKRNQRLHPTPPTRKSPRNKQVDEPRDHTSVVKEINREKSTQNRDKGKQPQKGSVVKKSSLNKSAAEKPIGQILQYPKPSTSKTKTDTAKVAQKTYRVDYSSDDLPWYEKQGQDYRKYKVEKAKEKVDLVEAIKKKTEALEGMAGKMADISQDMKKVDSEDPDMLWALALVPHMKRMPQSKKDRFMVFVLGKAFDVIEGKDL